MRLIRKEGNQVRLVVSEGVPAAIEASSQHSHTHVEKEEEFTDLERHTLTLDPKSKRRIIVHVPHTISTKDLDRIKNWLSYQINIEDDPA